MSAPRTRTQDRQDVAIEAAADALLAVCALQTGLDPGDAAKRALDAIAKVYGQAERAVAVAVSREHRT